MRKLCAIALLAIVAVGANGLPAEAAAKQWEVRIKDVSHQGSGNVTRISARLVSKNFVCMTIGPISVYYGPNFETLFGTVDGGTGDPDAEGNFFIDGSGPLGEYKIVRPRSTHSSDSGKKQVCLKATKKYVAE